MSTVIPDQPIASAGAWLGAEMAGTDDWVRRFTDAQIAELESAVAAARDSGKALDELTRADFPMSGIARMSRQWLRELDTGADPADPSVRSYRTRAEQLFHTDGADVIGLLCLQTARSGGGSRIVSSITVFNQILLRRPELVPLLFENFHFDRNEEQAAGEAPAFAIPLCYYDGERLRMFFIGWYIRDAQRHHEVPRLTEAQLELLDLIEALADEFALTMDFQPGDIQLLKNSTILHGRGAFEDWDDPERKRHLLRLWINADTLLADSGNVVKAVPAKSGAVSDSKLL